MSNTLLRKLVDVGIVQTGNFTLKSGEQSNVYCDFRRLVSHPRLLQEVCLELGTLIEDRQNVVIAGIPIGALAYASTVSTLHNIPSIIIREERKTYGANKIIEGDYTGQQPIVLIEDVITTGGSIMKIIDIIKSENLKIKEIITILDREKGGVEKLRSMGIPVKSLFTLSQLTNCLLNSTTRPLVKHITELITSKGSNLVLAADITDHRKLIDLVDMLGPYLLGVKLHIDIFDISVVPELVSNIKSLKAKHNLLIIEDRKFADIGAIVAKQINIIKGWADVVTAHGIVGDEMMKALNDANIGILPIHQLSTADNLIDTRYSWMVKSMAGRFNNIVGFITQEHVMDGLLNFSPGVSISSSGDAQGQRYNTPETMLKRGTDVFIVGRGITEDPDPVKRCIEYMNRCLPKPKQPVSKL
jgi:uridine monophosphate synthetase